MSEEVRKETNRSAFSTAGYTSRILPLTKYVAELIGTMVLVLIGCGTADLIAKFLGNTI